MFFKNLNSVFDFIEKNLENDINLESLSQILGTN